METPANVSDWAGRIRTDIEAAEWSWRNLEEREHYARRQSEATQSRLAQEDVEAEVSGLRAQLAVASYLEDLGAADTTGQEPIGDQLTKVEESDRHMIVSGLMFAAIINADRDRAVPSGIESRLRSTASGRNSATGDWWVSLEASLRWRDEELSRHSFQFYVRDERVTGWSGLTQAGHARPSEQGDPKTTSALSAPARLIAAGLDRRRQRTNRTA